MNQPKSQQPPYGGYPYQPYQTSAPMQGQPMYQQQPMPYQPGQQVQGAQVPTPAGGPQVPGMLPVEQSYIENILRLNKGKLVSVYSTFENNREWNAKIFRGTIEAAGRDHLILSQPETGKRV